MAVPNLVEGSSCECMQAGIGVDQASPQLCCLGTASFSSQPHRAPADHPPWYPKVQRLPSPAEHIHRQGIREDAFVMYLIRQKSGISICCFHSFGSGFWHAFYHCHPSFHSFGSGFWHSFYHCHPTHVLDGSVLDGSDRMNARIHSHKLCSSCFKAIVQSITPDMPGLDTMTATLSFIDVTITVGTDV